MLGNSCRGRILGGLEKYIRKIKRGQSRGLVMRSASVKGVLDQLLHHDGMLCHWDNMANSYSGVFTLTTKGIVGLGCLLM